MSAVPPVLTINFNKNPLDFLLTLSRASRISCTTCNGRFSPFVLKLLNSPSVTKPNNNSVIIILIIIYSDT